MMASDVQNLSAGDNRVNESLVQEPEQKSVESSLTEVSHSFGAVNTKRQVHPLTQETVWLKQLQYEHAETLYHMRLAGTTQLTNIPGTPGKRLHGHDNRAQPKKQKQDMKSPDYWNKKFKNEGIYLLKTTKNFQSRVEDLLKAQQRKSQIIKDATSRITAAMEECQTKLTNDLARSAEQINELKSLLSEIEVAVDKSNVGFEEKNWGYYTTQEKYCKRISEKLAKLNKELNTSYDLCNCFQADASKSEINRIVGEISRLALIKKHIDPSLFLKKKTAVDSQIKSLLLAGDDSAGACPSDSESSLEGSCSVSDGSGGDKRLKSGDGKKAKKIVQNNKHTMIKSSRNNFNATQAGRNKANLASNRPQSGSNAPMKRNAQGIQSGSDKKQDLFFFKGNSRPSSTPFLSQPGLLGPTPNVLSMHQGNYPSSFRFPGYMSAGQKQQSLSNFESYLSSANRSGFGHMSFNFSGIQSGAAPFGYAQNSAVASQSTGNNQMRQVRQQQIRPGKMPNQTVGTRQNFGYPLQQRFGSTFKPKSQAGLLGNRPNQRDNRDNVEQQLNEMAQKMQQMQHATSHNIQLQHLMRETERLKQLVAQKQHHNQQQDRFQQQFQLLINAFLQQQQQQQFQGPQSKMARAVQYQNTQKQHQKQLQQQKKRKQQQNKVQQVKQEPQVKQEAQKKSPKNEEEETQENKSAKTEVTLQNGDSSTSVIMPETKVISQNSKVTKISTFSPQTAGDKHKAGVSSLVVMEHIGCVVVVDIINSCLKLYDVHTHDSSQDALSHHLVTRLELSRPYYMGKLKNDMIVVSREGKLLSLVKVSKKRLEFLQDLRTESQYYGMGYVQDNVIVCAAFTDNRIDLLSIQDGVAQTVVLVTHCTGPELVAALPNTGCILYLERVQNETVHLLGISQQGQVKFSINLQSSSNDVWSVASISDKIVCCNKQSATVKLFSQDGIFLSDITFPPGTVNQPFAMTFCDSGLMYIANDGAWDEEYEHYITTDINVYSFS